jgi:hypothetical protein
MIWLLDNGCPWDWQTFAAAAENVTLENMNCSRINKRPWNWKAFASAGGDLSSMQ